MIFLNFYVALNINNLIIFLKMYKDGQNCAVITEFICYFLTSISEQVHVNQYIILPGQQKMQLWLSDQLVGKYC